MNQKHSNCLSRKNILFVGAGKMGGAILSRMVEIFIENQSQNFSPDSVVQGSLSNKNFAKNQPPSSAFLPPKFTVLKPSNSNQIRGANYISSAESLEKSYVADLIILAIKPQLAQKVLASFSKYSVFGSKTVFLSILAGKDCQFFYQFFGAQAKICRIMPNLPVSIGKGIIPYFFGSNFEAKEKNFLLEIFSCLGSSFEVDLEEKFHQFTALFGCGPAYIFLLQEIFLKISQDFGLDRELSKKLIETLFLGSIKLSSQGASCNDGFGLDFLELINSVASKGGVTEAALEVLNENSQLKKLFHAAIQKAAEKSKILSVKS